MFSYCIMRKQLILRTYTIDQIGYDENNRQAKVTTDSYTIYGYANATRTRLIFNDINLRSIFGKEYDNRDEFTIKLTNVRAVNERTANIVTYGDPACLRTCNLVMKGLNTLSDKNNVIIGQFTNFNPNHEKAFNVMFHRGNATNFIHNYGLQQLENFEFCMALHQYAGGNNIQNCRYLMSGPAVPELHGQVVTPTNVVYNALNGSVTFGIVVANTGNFPASIPQYDTPMTITFVPPVNEWHFMTINAHVHEDEKFGIEITFRKPYNNLNLEFELRDILTDKLQPVTTTTKVYPSLELVFDLY